MSVSLPEYPNIETLVSGMPDGMQSMALMYLTMIPQEVVQSIEEKIPTLVEAHNNDDDETIIEMIMALGASREYATEMAEMRHGFNQE